MVRHSYICTVVIEHGAEHCGQLVVYYRANGMVPPDSRPQVRESGKTSRTSAEYSGAQEARQPRV
jgi:hypothetical protein